MSGSTAPGVAFSGLTPAPQTTDGDTALLLQGGMFRQISTKAMVCSYTPAGAVLLGGGAGASRGATTVPTSGDPMVGYALHSTLEVLPPLQAGGPSLIGVSIGTTAGTVAAGNDARINSAALTDANGNLHLAGSTLSLAEGVFAITSDSAGNTKIVASLPSTDPHVVNQLWNNDGVLAISAG